MALNKFMHPRNIYKTPPDFSKLFKEFEDFSTVAKMDVTGKVRIDFKDPRAVRVLTKCLLKADFNLDVIIPEDRLVPTLPLRLNYILWIEDLMTAIGIGDTVSGLDIGTGACAIYPLLASVKNKWNMVGTEKDETSFQRALDNVERNNLQHLVKVRNNKTTSLIEHLFQEDNGIKFDFCMCNPPFYSNIQDLWDSRSLARPPPKNGFTGSPQELITEGGELEFCRKLIMESVKYKEKILIFTTMVGHKYNMMELVLDLKAEDIKHTTTEFCQGRVTRWGLAWTFHEYDILNLVPPRDKPRKRTHPINFVLPELQCNNVENATERIKILLGCLDIDYKVITIRRNEVILNFKASKNTWSNQRRKRRLKKLEEDNCKRIKLEENTETTGAKQGTSNPKLNMAISHIGLSSVSSDIDDSKTCKMLSEDNSTTTSNVTKNLIKKCHTQGIEKINSKCKEDVSNKRNLNDQKEVSESKQSISNTELDTSASSFTELATVSNNMDNERECKRKILSEDKNSKSNVIQNQIEKCLVTGIIKISSKGSTVVLELEYVDGCAGKEGIHQILQYIKNNWK